MLTQCSRDLRYVRESRLREMLGLTPEQVIGKPIAEIMGPSLRPFVGTSKLSCSAARSNTKKCRFGQLDLADSRRLPARQGWRKRSSWVSSIVDITERKRAEELLHESEGRQTALIAGKNGGLGWNIMTGKVIWSAVWKRFTVWSRAASVAPSTTSSGIYTPKTGK